MKNFFFAACAVLSLSLATVAHADPAKLGLVLPLSGDYAFVGSGIRDGINLALSEDPELKSAVKIIFEDDEGLNRKATVSAVKKLIEFDRVNILAVTAVNTVTSVAKLVSTSKLPTLVVWDSNSHINSLSEYIYGYGFSNEAAGSDMADFAFNKLNAKSTTVVSAQDEWSEIVSKSFKEEFKKLGGLESKNFEVSLGETDFRSMVAEIRRANPDAVYAPLLSGSLRSFLKQLKQSGYPGKVLTGDGFSSADIEALGSAAEGTYVMQMWYADKAFEQRYLKLFGRSSDSVNLCFAALGYDFIGYVKAIVKAVTAAEKPFDAESLRLAFVTTAYKGILGETNFNRSRLSNRKETVLVVKGGVFSPVN